MHRLVRPLIAALVAAPALAAQSATPRIVVGPDRLVSRDIDLPHWELMIAAAPTDPELLVGAGTVNTGTGCCISQLAFYTSTDGGGTWTGRLVTGTVGDPQVAVGSGGTLLFAGMGVKDDRPTLLVARSEDRGTSWSSPLDITLANAAGCDHPQLVVDHSAGRFRGRVYMAALTCGAKRKTWNLNLFHSEDDGRSWQGPVEFEPGSDSVVYNTTTPVVLGDGTLVLSYVEFRLLSADGRDLANWRGPGQQPREHLAIRKTWLVTSADGGTTFTSRRCVQEDTTWHGVPRFGQRPHHPSFPFLAADGSGRYPDRLYMVDIGANAGDEGGDRLFVRHSDDRGAMWSGPVLVAPGVAADVEQRHPSIAVNKDGIVGVRWLDTRHGRWQRRDSTQWYRAYDEYFTASLDGGQSFLRAVRVSSASSPTNFIANIRNRPLATRVNGRGDSLSLELDIPPFRHDYLGLAADAHGVFHPFWPDARDTLQRIHTAAIWVQDTAQSASRPRVRQAIIAPGQFRVDIDRAHYDSATGLVELPLRLQNLTGAALYAPLRLTATIEQRSASEKPTLLSFLNGDRAARPASRVLSAEYDLAPAISLAGMLFSSERTAPLVIRLKTRGEPRGQLTFTLSAGTPTAPATPANPGPRRHGSLTAPRSLFWKGPSLRWIKKPIAGRTSGH